MGREKGRKQQPGTDVGVERMGLVEKFSANGIGEVYVPQAAGREVRSSPTFTQYEG